MYAGSQGGSCVDATLLVCNSQEEPGRTTFVFDVKLGNVPTQILNRFKVVAEARKVCAPS